MSYANTNTKRAQVLEALRATFEVSDPSTRFWVPERVVLFEGASVALGEATPAVAIIPQEESLVRSLACAQDEWSMTVAVIGVLRMPPASIEWKDQAHRFLGDLQQAVADNRQLDGLAVYVEQRGASVSDAETTGNRSLAMCELTLEVIYRISVADVTV